MKKTLLIALAISLMLLTFTIPTQAWSWKDDAKFEVAEYWVYVAEEGEIKIDAELDEVYLKGTKIESYDDEESYFRYPKFKNEYGKITKGQFVAYVAVDAAGLFVYAEIEDVTIFDELDDNGNSGDCFQIYLDWCTPDIVHPRPHKLYEMYSYDGMGWNHASYKSSYSVAGLQYLGWISCDYKNNIAASGGFAPYDALGPESTDSVLLETKLIDGGWACELFIPWRDEEQKKLGGVTYYSISSSSKENQTDEIWDWCGNSNINNYVGRLGIGFQACDDSDINNIISPDKEENIGIRFDQRKELGLSYWSDYSMLADIVWSERLEKVPSEPTVETSDSMPAILVAFALSGAGIIVFSKKKKDKI